MQNTRLVIAFLVITFAISCNKGRSPRPRGYFRIDLPQKSYQLFDSIHPYSFEFPVYSKLVADTHELSEPYWTNLVFPSYKGTIHLSYKPVNSREDLMQYFDDARVFAQRHIPKATAIREEVISHEENRVFGLLYQIRGREAASPIQFYVTDSTAHFLRGALYFEVSPNNDSLAPVIRFIEEDIRHMLEGLRWKTRE